MKGFTNTPYDHPGFPKIDAVAKFRQNVVKKLDKQQTVLNKKVREMQPIIGSSNIRSNANSLNVKNNPNDIVRFQGYFDSSGYSKMVKTMQKKVKEMMKIAMDDAITNAADETMSEIMNMSRAFKGKYKSNTSSEGDMYEKVGQSLWFGLKASKGANQFTSYYAGSYGERQGFNEEPTGVLGSRGANLTELTAEGTGEFKISSHPLGGTKRLVSHLKNARGG
jgi:hypothetical protein